MASGGGEATDETDPEVWLYLASLLLLATMLRVFQIGSSNHYRPDEIVTKAIVDGFSPVEIATQVWTFSAHPPLYYVAADLWTAVAGLDQIGLRSLSAVFGVGAVVMAYLVGSRLEGQDLGLFAAAVIAVSQFHLHYSQIARMYTLLIFLVLASYLGFIALLDRWSRRRATVHAVTTIALALTHVFAALIVLAQAVTVVVLSRRGDTRPSGSCRGWVSLYGVVSIAALPWYVMLVTTELFGNAIQYATWIPEPSLGSATIGLVAPFAPMPSTAPLVLPVFLALAGLGASSYVVDLDPLGIDRLDHDWAATVLVLWLAVPFVVSLAYSLAVRPVFWPRYVSGAAVAGVFLVAAGLTSIRPIRARWLVAAALLAVVIWGVPIHYDLNDDYKMGEAMAHVDASSTDDSLVMVQSGRSQFRMGPEGFSKADYVDAYLERSDATVRPLESVIGNGSAAKLPEDHETVWTVTAPVMPASRELVAAGYRLVETRTFGDVMVRRYRTSPDRR